jgi:ATP-dependent helicase/nuclease subunit A
VTRYINLLRTGVDPSNILAITFTRKAAAEMRERILAELRGMAARSALDAARWRELRDRLGDIGISTIDAFCLSLLREFPLEADLDPGFAVADETEVPRFTDEALDGALRAARRLVVSDEDVALVMAAVGERKVRAGLGALLDRRLVAGHAIRRFIDVPRHLARALPSHRRSAGSPPCWMRTRAAWTRSSRTARSIIPGSP